MGSSLRRTPTKRSLRSHGRLRQFKAEADAQNSHMAFPKPDFTEATQTRRAHILANGTRSPTRGRAESREPYT